MRRVLALILALALAAPACAQITPGYGTPSLLGDGTFTNPAYSFASAPSEGFWRIGTGTWGWHATAGTAYGFTVPTQNTDGFGLYVNAFYQAINNKTCWLSSAVTGTDTGLTLSSAADACLWRPQSKTVAVSAGGSISTPANVGGTLFLDSTTHGNVGATLQAINTYTLPASVLSVNGKTIKVTAFLATANNAAAKTIGIRWCGNQIAGTMTASIAGGVRLEAYLARTGSNAQNTFTTITEGLTSATLTQAKVFSSANFGAGNGITCTDSGTIAVDLMAQGTSNNDITSGLMIVEVVN